MKTIILKHPLPECADKEEQDEYQHYRTVLKIDAPCQLEECPPTLKSEPAKELEATHCFCVFHPEQEDHSTPQCDETKSPSRIEKA